MTGTAAFFKLYFKQSSKSRIIIQIDGLIFIGILMQLLLTIYKSEGQQYFKHMEQKQKGTPALFNKRN